ncbi:MAG: sialidase family protein, partial [Planctomycetia bacterium]|nr:sialidase family protein [Planctomycetia bacterium]
MRKIFVLSLLACFFVSGLAHAQNEQLPLIDISQDVERHIVIAQGTPTIYQGHPYSVQMKDPNTIFVVWNIGHGGYGGPMAKTTDGGKTWTRIDDRLPESYRKHKNCPSIYRLTNSEGKEFLWVFSAQPKIARIVSEDAGETWHEEPSLGFSNVMAFSSIVPKNPGKQDGCYIGFFHQQVGNDGTVHNTEGFPNSHLRVVQSETTDAGFTWSEPKCVCEVPGKNPCEPFAFWSP